MAEGGGFTEDNFELMMEEMRHGDDDDDQATPLISNEEIQRRLSALREDPITGLLDTTKADTSVNPLSEEDKAKQIQKVKNFIKARYPNAKFDDLVIKFSSKTSWILWFLEKGAERPK